MNNKKISLLFLVILLTLSLNSVEKNLKIYVPNTLSSIPLLELNNKQIKGSTVTTEFYQDHIITMARFINGEIDMIMTGFTQGAMSYLGNQTVIHVITPVWGVSLMVAKDSSIKKIDDLINKKVMVPFEKSPLDLQLKFIFKEKGLTEKITIEYMPIQQAIPMLLNDKIDGISIPEPFASKLIIAGSTYKVFAFADLWGEVNQGEKRSPQVSLFVKKDFITKNNSFLKAFIKELDKNIKAINKNSDNYSLKYSKTFNLDKEVLAAGLKNTYFEIIDSQKSKTISTDFMKKIGYADRWDDSFYYVY